MADPSPSTADSSAAGPVLTPVSMHIVRPNDPIECVVVSNERCTNSKASSFVRHIEIDISGTPLEGSFRAGQSFGVVPPGEDEKGRPHKVRLYSLACSSKGEDGAGRIVSTTVKRTIDEHWETDELYLGVASNFLCDRKPGDKVLMSGPNGKRFVLPEDPSAHNYVFVATGTGIAPFRGMLHDLQRLDHPPRTALVMGAPYRTELLYDDHLASLDATCPWFTYHTAISREGAGQYVNDRMLEDGGMLGEILRDDRTLVYVCGIAGMEIGVLRAIWEMLPREAASGYLSVDESVVDEPDGWTRRMLHKQVKPTRRVMMEVY